MRRDIYNYGRKLQANEASIKNAGMPEYNKKVILDFKRHLVLKGLSKPRVLKYMEVLKTVFLRMNKDFREVTKEDICAFVGDVQQRNIQA